MSLSNATVTVGTTPTLLYNPGPDFAGHENRWAEVYNGSGVTVYVGGPDVDTSTGRPIEDGGSWSASFGKGDALYGVVAASTADVQVLKSRQ